MDDMTANLKDKTVLVTGASRGMGRHVAEAAARAGAEVLLHGRDEGLLTAITTELRDAGHRARWFAADFADLAQVRALAERVRAEVGRLDVLVNNAVVGGGSAPKTRELSAQGHELRFAVNHLAPLLLSRELAPLLAAAAPARIVNVASIGQDAVVLDDVMFERDYDGLTAYCRSKTALIMSTFDLSAEYADRGITVNALHPAHLMDTAAVREYGLVPEVGVEHGGAPTLRLMADPALETVTGRYFDRFDDRFAHPQTYDEEARQRVRELSLRLIG